MYLKKWTVLFGLVALVMAGAPRMSEAVPTVFFGEDLLAGAGGLIPNSSAARDAFLAALASQGLSAGLEDFESFAAGDDFRTNTALEMSFTGPSPLLPVTGDLTGGQIRAGDDGGGRFPISGTNYLFSARTRTITFDVPVTAFGLFVIDANEVDNPVGVASVDGTLLTQAEIDARPFGTADGIFRLLTDRSDGTRELLGGDQATPVKAGDGGVFFLGVIDVANPLTNVILINGASGLDRLGERGVFRH